MPEQYDVVIIGGGGVGASLALILAPYLKIAVVDAAPGVRSNGPNTQDKTIVIAESSRLIFESIGVWNKLSVKACPIQEIQVSDQGRFGSSRLSANDEKLPALGYVLSAGDINAVLRDALIQSPNITLFQPAEFVAFSYEDAKATVEITSQQEKILLTAQLLVGADGNFSSVRQFLNINTQVHDYRQMAVLSTAQLRRPHEGVAHERFTPEGPLALLPLLGQKSAVIWTTTKEKAEKLMHLSASEFKEQLQINFGYRLGKIEACGSRTLIPLQLIKALQQIAPGVVLVGNAVHTLHPVAGQGLNLALRDLSILAEEIYCAYRKGEPLGHFDRLKHYLSRIEQNQQQTITMTHALVNLFSNSLLPMVMARNMGMILINHIPTLKKQFTRRALGYFGKVPRLACGMELE